MNIHSFVVLLLLSVFADAQTETVLNAAGATVVEVITQNAAGIPTTRVLETLGGGTSLSSSPLTTAGLSTTNPLLQTTAALTTSTPQQVGPVGQPASTPLTPGGPTPYQYTTTDANGNPVVAQGVFTPTGPATVLPSQSITGTVLDYSQWLSMVGTFTAPPSAAGRTTPLATGWYCFAATTLAGLVGGAWLIVF